MLILSSFYYHNSDGDIISKLFFRKLIHSQKQTGSAKVESVGIILIKVKIPLFKCIMFEIQIMLFKFSVFCAARETLIRRFMPIDI